MLRGRGTPLAQSWAGRAWTMGGPARRALGRVQKCTSMGVGPPANEAGRRIGPRSVRIWALGRAPRRAGRGVGPRSVWVWALGRAYKSASAPAGQSQRARSGRRIGSRSLRVGSKEEVCVGGPSQSERAKLGRWTISHCLVSISPGRGVEGSKTDQSRGAGAPPWVRRAA